MKINPGKLSETGYSRIVMIIHDKVVNIIKKIIIVRNLIYYNNSIFKDFVRLAP